VVPVVSWATGVDDRNSIILSLIRTKLADGLGLAILDDVLAIARLVRVGDRHSRPVRDSIPSDADLAKWARHSEEAGVLPYPSVIVTPGGCRMDDSRVSRLGHP
jgi:hypothetical protein